MNRADAKPGLSFKDWGIRAMLNTAPGWPPTAIDPSKGFKFQTRRVIKPQPIPNYDDQWCWEGGIYTPYELGRTLPRWRLERTDDLGQLYYAKEALVRKECFPPTLNRRTGLPISIARYGADAEVVLTGHRPFECALAWTWQGDRLKEWYMPAEAARLFYVLRGIRAEQVQEISEDDAIAEGAEEYLGSRADDALGWTMRRAFRHAFDDINGSAAWAENPFVWVYEWERVEL